MNNYLSNATTPDSISRRCNRVNNLTLKLNNFLIVMIFVRFQTYDIRLVFLRNLISTKILRILLSCCFTITRRHTTIAPCIGFEALIEIVRSALSFTRCRFLLKISCLGGFVAYFPLCILV